MDGVDAFAQLSDTLRSNGLKYPLDEILLVAADGRRNLRRHGGFRRRQAGSSAGIASVQARRA